jgi:DNA-binding CsgD family transcriptional regulator
MGHTALHGRETEVRRLSEAIMAVAAGQGCVMVVEGPAGLGKSRFLQEAASWARSVGVVVAPGEADELHRLSPLSPLLAALHGSVPPILGDTELDTAHALDYDRFQLIDQLAVVLREKAHTESILVTIDDLPWADPLTLLALQSLTDQLAVSPVMWLLSRRPWPSTPALDDMVTNLVLNGATVIELAPLSTGAVAAVADDVLGAAPDRALEGLLEKCGGNPFMVVELLRTLAQHDELVTDTSHARLLPGGASGRLYERLSGLTPVSPLTRQMLEVASIFGRVFDVRCVAQVLHRTVAELLPSVHEALDADLVVDDGAQLGFRQVVVREAAYSALPVSARKTLHLEAANAVLSIGGSAVEAAAHVMKGAEVGDAHAVALVVGASDGLASTSPGTAADLRLQAADLMSHTDPDRAVRVAETVGLLLRAGRGEEGQALAEAALHAGLPTQLEARLRFQLAEALGIGGRSASALHHTRTALQLQGVDDSTRACLFAAESNAHLVAGDPGAALRAGEGAIAIGGSSGNVASAGRALLTMGAAERMRGRLTRSLELIDQAVQLVPPGSVVSRQLEPQWTRGRTLIALDRFDEASAAFDAASRWAEKLGTAWTAVFEHSCRAMLLLYQGALDDAVAEGEAGLIRAEELGSWTYVPELSAVLAEVNAYQGKLEQARNHLRLGSRLVGERTSFAAQLLAWASAVVGQADAEEPRQVLAHLAGLYDQLPDRMPTLAFDAMIGPCLVAHALRAGDRRKAGLAAEAAESLSRINPGVTSLAAAGMQARGLLDEDVDRLVAAARAFAASPRPLARARVCEDAAEGLARGNRHAEAVDHLETALAEYERVGARSPARRVRERLSGLTAREDESSRAPRPAFGWGSMTAAELRVARLAASGLTNRAIAHELALSPHTVESHLRHAFHKLDIRSRVELTRVVLSHEPAPGE